MTTRTLGTSGMRVLRFVVERAILLHCPIEIVVLLVIDVRRTRLDGQVVFERGLAVASIDQAGFGGLLQRLFPCRKSTAYLLLILEDGIGHVPAPFDRDMRSVAQMFQGLACSQPFCSAVGGSSSVWKSADSLEKLVRSSRTRRRWSPEGPLLRKDGHRSKAADR